MNALARKLGPLPLWVWLAGAVGVAYVLHRRHSSAAAGSAPPAQSQPPDPQQNLSPYGGLAEQLAALTQALSSPSASPPSTAAVTTGSPSPGNAPGPVVSPGNTGTPGRQPVGELPGAPLYTSGPYAGALYPVGHAPPGYNLRGQPITSPGAGFRPPKEGTVPIGPTFGANPPVARPLRPPMQFAGAPGPGAA